MIVISIDVLRLVLGVCFFVLRLHVCIYVCVKHTNDLRVFILITVSLLPHVSLTCLSFVCIDEKGTAMQRKPLWQRFISLFIDEDNHHSEQEALVVDDEHQNENMQSVFRTVSVELADFDCDNDVDRAVGESDEDDGNDAFAVMAHDFLGASCDKEDTRRRTIREEMQRVASWTQSEDEKPPIG